MGHSRGAVALSKPRLPDDTPSFEWMVRDSIHTVASRRTPWREAARLFGERYGVLLALADAFREQPGRADALRRMFDLARGIVSHGKRVLQNAWDERSRPVIERWLEREAREIVASRAARSRVDELEDAFAEMSSTLDQLDREPNRSEAAVEFATLWARLRYAPTLLRDRRDKASEEERTLVDAAIRSAGRWVLELEETWCVRTFDELLGEPRIDELFRLVFPVVENAWPKPEE